MFEATAHNFKAQVLEADLPVLVEFTADWCPPCKMLTPVLKALAQKYADKLHVGFIDSDTNQKIVEQYNVLGLPTMLLFANGEPVQRIVGYNPLERIEAKLLPHLMIENA